MECGGSDYFSDIFFVIDPFRESAGMAFHFLPEFKSLLRHRKK
jgi:hypothetical protein